MTSIFGRREYVRTIKMCHKDIHGRTTRLYTPVATHGQYNYLVNSRIARRVSMYVTLHPNKVQCCLLIELVALLVFHVVPIPNPPNSRPRGDTASSGTGSTMASRHGLSRLTHDILAWVRSTNAWWSTPLYLPLLTICIPFATHECQRSWDWNRASESARGR